MSTEIYYFSGTGNSLHVAKELQKRIPDAALIPVVSLLGKDVIKTWSETVGFVFPIHLTTLPIPMREFVKKLDPTSAKYIFAVGTRIGTFCLADIALENVLKKKGKRWTPSFRTDWMQFKTSLSTEIQIQKTIRPVLARC